MAFLQLLRDGYPPLFLNTDYIMSAEWIRTGDHEYVAIFMSTGKQYVLTGTQRDCFTRWWNSAAQIVPAWKGEKGGD